MNFIKSLIIYFFDLYKFKFMFINNKKCFNYNNI